MKNRSWFNSLKNKNRNKTISAHHNFVQKEIRNENKKLNQYTAELNNLKKKLDRINSKDVRQCSKEELHSRWKYKERIMELEEKIKRINANELQHEYLSSTLTFFIEDELKENKFNPKYPSALDASKNQWLTLNNSSTVPMDHFITSSDNQQNLCRADKLDTFMELIYTVNSTSVKNNNDICKKCGTDTVIDRTGGTRSCKSCGNTYFCFVESERPLYIDTSQDNSFYSYKRVNHFNEGLCQIQAKESTNIPEEVMKVIKKELTKMKIKNIKTISVKHMKQILKKLKFNKYCEHAPHIIAKLNGIKPPKISSQIEQELRTMFLQIQAPFAQVCPKNRKNFLSYSYVLHKMLELKDLDEFLIYFPLLKSREKLYAQDLIWKDICKILKWEFIPSV